MNKETEIFAWLLGMSGDFPASEPGKRYGFRTELIKKLLDAGYSFNENHEVIAPTPSSAEVYRKALEEAVEVIKGWHNMNPSGKLTDEQVALAWKLYFDHAPEMKPIREALSHSGQGEETKGEEQDEVMNELIMEVRRGQHPEYLKSKYLINRK